MPISNFLLIVSLAAVVCGIALSILIVRQSKERTGVFLAVYMLSLSAALLEPVLHRFFSSPANNLYFELLGSYTFLLGPLLFLYCGTGVGQRTVTGLDYLHFIPFVLYISLVLLIQQRSDVLEFFVYELFIVHVLCYSVLSIRILKKEEVKPSTLAGEVHAAFVKKVPRISLVLFLAIALFSNGSLFFNWILTNHVVTIIQLAFIIYLFFIVLINPELLVNKG